tara:strand:- start:16 stop:492 length:477 start_codon:yes stop_codon:yes gene_type:complete
MNQICPPYPECLTEENIGYQDCQYIPGGECYLDNNEVGFYDCEYCCWDIGLLSWIGDGYCDQFGGCAWEGPQFNCYELSYDCGDCQEFDEDISGYCSECADTAGDINNDSIPNILDILIIVNCILNNACDEYECSDLNSDSVINILDIIQLINIILSN